MPSDPSSGMLLPQNSKVRIRIVGPFWIQMVSGDWVFRNLVETLWDTNDNVWAYITEHKSLIMADEVQYLQTEEEREYDARARLDRDGSGTAQSFVPEIYPGSEVSSSDASFQAYLRKDSQS